MTTDQHLTAADCAREIGLTTRALRVYEERGLLTPQRTAKGWRVYGPAEIERLNQILTLRSMGLSLSQIGEALAPGGADFATLLQMQEQHLTDKRRDIDAALARIAALRPALTEGHALPIGDLIALAKETQALDTQTDDIAWKRYEQARPRTAIDMPAEALGTLPGAYRLFDDSFCEIKAEDGKLFIRVNAQPQVEMFAEAPDAYFLKLVPAQITIQRSGGDVTGLTIHQNGQEISATRTTAKELAEAEVALADRKSARQPLAESEPALRRLIDEHLSGQIDYARITPALAELMRPQEGMARQELVKAGALQEARFLGVDDNGFDVFELRFENTRQNWGIAHDNVGRVDGLFMRPAL
ncbi:MerR family transcriptional regulator [Flavimaricola marinus]|uniref:HTH-type transcriptional activator mta n=1 Tax=Flavimaricola marinus TaxID=1819565 RepID=A0A238LDR7_9RHOB|nr:MerR family transcriptional regulator [Flavimaricola marinus]SMY07761.1 HTH-type transcriptional activator mta [Flavimaricola marinus]